MARATGWMALALVGLLAPDVQAHLDYDGIPQIIDRVELTQVTVDRDLSGAGSDLANVCIVATLDHTPEHNDQTYFVLLPGYQEPRFTVLYGILHQCGVMDFDDDLDSYESGPGWHLVKQGGRGRAGGGMANVLRADTASWHTECDPGDDWVVNTYVATMSDAKRDIAAIVESLLDAADAWVDAGETDAAAATGELVRYIFSSTGSEERLGPVSIGPVSQRERDAPRRGSAAGLTVEVTLEWDYKRGRACPADTTTATTSSSPVEPSEDIPSGDNAHEGEAQSDALDSQVRIARSSPHGHGGNHLAGKTRESVAAYYGGLRTAASLLAAMERAGPPAGADPAVWTLTMRTGLQLVGNASALPAAREVAEAQGSLADAVTAATSRALDTAASLLRENRAEAMQDAVDHHEAIMRTLTPLNHPAYAGGPLGTGANTTAAPSPSPSTPVPGASVWVVPAAAALAWALIRKRSA